MGASSKKENKKKDKKDGGKKNKALEGPAKQTVCVLINLICEFMSTQLIGDVMVYSNILVHARLWIEQSL